MRTQSLASIRVFLDRQPSALFTFVGAGSVCVIIGLLCFAAV